MDDIIRKRRISILLILAIISSTALFAQGSAEKAPSDGKLSGKVTMWTFPVTGNDQVIFNEMITEFNKAYPDVTVDVQVLPWNGRYEKMLTAIAGGNPPNVVYLNDFQIPMFAHTNNLVPMNEVFTESELGIYKTGAKNAASVGGTLYAIPVLTNSLGYLYNVDLFVEAGLDPNFPPETWTDLEVAIAKLTKKDANMGIFFIKKGDVLNYIGQYMPMQLRYSSSTATISNAPIMNFGEAKGLYFKHFIIYPTQEMLKWLCAENCNLEESTRAKLYVALTRAFFSVGIIVQDSFNKTVPGITLWQAN